MNRVTDRIFVGSRRFSRRELRREGITHIINARRKRDRLAPEFVVFNHPMVDDGCEKGSAHWIETMEFGVAALEVPGSKLYVHCKAGVNRGPGNCYAVLRALGFSPDSAWRMITTARPKVRPRYVEQVEHALLVWGSGRA